MTDLFPAADPSDAPLASRMRPLRLEEYVGQEHLLGAESALRRALEAGRIHSMILWGPPGVGKTTLALLLARYVDAHFLTLSAVLSGVKEIRTAIDEARYHRQQGRLCVLFVDEVHRFNKSQQDAFLPHIEEGTIIFIGATTENPSFELNAALLSRARVHVLRSLDTSVIAACLATALTHPRGFAGQGPRIADGVLEFLAEAAQGDLRRAYNFLEVGVALAEAGSDPAGRTLHKELAREAVGHSTARFDKHGDQFYDQISALHKSVRGSSPDGALYWLARMLEGGCDPLYVARRLVRMASEDIGNADPRALSLAMAAWDAQERLGDAEGALALAQAAAYLACAPKSNAVYTAFNAVRAAVRAGAIFDVPVHLRNAPTALMASLGHGADYRYAHDFPDAFVAGESYLPEPLAAQRWYEPVERGLEIKIREKLRFLATRDAQSAWKRYANGGGPSS
jgi:putative ATPase